MTTTHAHGAAGAAAYYRFSSAAPPVGVITALAGGLASGFALAFAYAYLIVYVPIVGYVTFLFAAGFGIGVGLITGKLLRAGKVRSRTLSVAVVLAVVLVSYYVSWAAWLHALSTKADVGFGIDVFLFDPAFMLDMIESINEIGSWSLKGATPTGTVLWILWGLEAVIVVGGGLVFGIGASQSTPFCERCRVWCDNRGPIAFLSDDRLSLDDRDQLRGALERKDWRFVEGLGAIAPGLRHYKLELFACGKCHELNTLDVDHVRVKIGKDNQSSDATTEVVRKLLITPDEARWLTELGTRPHAPDPTLPVAIV